MPSDPPNLALPSFYNKTDATDESKESYLNDVSLLTIIKRRMRLIGVFLRTSPQQKRAMQAAKYTPLKI